MKLLANAFSLQMLAGSCRARMTQVEPYSDPAERSVVGHADIARLMGVPYNRESVSGLTTSDMVHVVQVTGGRLPEGCTELPAGVRLEHWRVEIE